jgi:hypothetical protein
MNKLSPMSLDELSQYKEGKKIYVCIKGVIFDVS